MTKVAVVKFDEMWQAAINQLRQLEENDSLAAVKDFFKMKTALEHHKILKENVVDVVFVPKEAQKTLFDVLDVPLHEFQRKVTDKEWEAAVHLLITAKRRYEIAGIRSRFDRHVQDKVLKYIITSVGDGYFLGSELLKVAKRGRSTEEQDVAKELIETYPIFKRINIQMFNQKAGAKKFHTVLEEFHNQKLNASMTNFESATLQTCFDIFKQCYDDLISSLIWERQIGEAEGDTSELKIQKQKPVTMKNIIKQLRTISKQLHGKIDFTQKENQVGNALGNIFALWTILESGNSFMLGREALMQPHPAQVLTILRMLGIGSGSAMNNHIGQVGTGEGKSITLGVLSAFLALLGFDVFVVCYSKYLSNRDREMFERLFTKLRNCDLADYPVTYGTVKTLAESVLHECIGDTRAMARAVMKGQNVGYGSALWNACKSVFREDKSAKKILLIDEVDVFFGEDFYGQVHLPAVILNGPAGLALVKAVDALKDKNPSFQDLQQTHGYKMFEEEFPSCKPLLEKKFPKMVKAAKNPEAYLARPDKESMCKVAYYDDKIKALNTSLHYPQTPFAYLKYVNEGRLSKEAENEIGVAVTCGGISIADLPNEFGLKLGLTGSYAACSSEEKRILKDRYNFTQYSYFPSLFPKVDGYRFPDDGFQFVVGNEEDWFARVKKSAQVELQKGRSCIIVFEDDEKLEAFSNYVQVNDVFRVEGGVEKITIKQKTDHSLLEDRILATGKSRTVTFIHCDYGRGCDFVCRDSATKAKGGVHVICTFPPTKKADEVQIRGRTGRQGESGSFEQIIHWDVCAKFGLNDEDQAQLEERKGAFIDEKREEVLLKERFDRIEEHLQNSEEANGATRHFIASFKCNDMCSALQMLVSFQ